MRAFLAIDLPEAVRASAVELQAHLRTGRKVPEENLHLTLAFLDDQSEAALEDLHQALGAVRCKAFSLELSGLDMFGGRHPRVLFLKAVKSRPLTELHQQVKLAAREVGIDLPRERFRPHVTLARFRRDLIEDQAIQIGSFMAIHGNAAVPVFDVAQYHLYASTLHPDGAKHELLADYTLKEEVR